MASPSQNNGIPNGQQKPWSTWGEFNNIGFVIQQMLGRLQTATLVKIIKCTNSGGLSPVGFVDVLPMVNQLDAAGTAVPHSTIYNVPYFRMQGGANAVIIDPEPGDIGIAVFASRDISKVKSTRKQGNPGSMRQYSPADALYIGGTLNAAPTQYVQFSSAGIKIHSPTLINLDAPDIQLNAETVEIAASSSVTVTTPTFKVNGATVLNGSLSQGTGSGGGTATLQGPVTVVGDLTAAGTSVHSHTHGNVQNGPGTTSAPL